MAFIEVDRITGVTIATVVAPTVLGNILAPAYFWDSELGEYMSGPVAVTLGSDSGLLTVVENPAAAIWNAHYVIDVIVADPDGVAVVIFTAPWITAPSGGGFWDSGSLKWVGTQTGLLIPGNRAQWEWGFSTSKAGVYQGTIILYGEFAG